MKKFLLFLIILVTSFSYGQLLDLGIKAGANYANFKSETIETTPITTYHVGIVANIKLLKPLSIQPEVLYSTQGASYKTLVNDFKSELGYMSVPILLKIHLGKILSLDAGPQFSYLLSKKVDTSSTINEFDFALAGGLSIYLTERLNIQGRYLAGLTDVDKNADFKNAVGQLSLVYMF